MSANVKIGIVLPQDNQKEIFFHVGESSCFFWQGSKKIRLSRNTEFSVKIFQGLLRLCQNENVLDESAVAKIQNNNKDLTKQKSCLCLDGISVGRNFHWQNKISQTLPGHFEFSIQNDCLIMVNELPLAIYIPSVATSEMNAKCPEDLIKAQIICARSWFLAHAENKHIGWDACNDDCCQRYQGLGNMNSKMWKIAQAVDGIVLQYNNQICDARYSKCCGGITESSHYVWPETQQAYLNSVYDGAEKKDFYNLTTDHAMQSWIVETPDCFCSPKIIPQKKLLGYLGKVDVADHYFRWEQNYSKDEINQILQQKLGLHINKLLNLYLGKRGNSGRLYQLSICYLDNQNTFQVHHLTSEYQIRVALHKSFLYSSAFIIQEQQNPQGDIEHIKIIGAGWGHGVGLCQMGALGMALHGYNYEKILFHYFPGSILTKI